MATGNRDMKMAWSINKTGDHPSTINAKVDTDMFSVNVPLINLIHD